MRGNHRELSEKYKAFRLQPSALFLSRFLQTFFNKFIKGGKKAQARTLMYRALINLRMTVRRPVMYYVLLRMFRRLRLQFLLASFRKGRKILNVPVPIRRNKRDVLNLQTVTNAVKRRDERRFVDRLSAELINLVRSDDNATSRQITTHNSRVYDERVNMDYR
jgi:ribosomal protein S7